MKKLNIIVAGTIASDPFAGMAWMHMQIVLSLLKLGHNVYYFETSSAWPYDPVLKTRVNTIDYALPYLKKLFIDFGIEDRWAFRSSFLDKQWYGLAKQKAEDLLANADAVFNVSGSTRFKDLKVGRLIYFGTDPVYHEIKYAQGDPYSIQLINEHMDAVTYGENIGKGDCPIPPLPNLKATTRQPIVMEYWQSGKPTKKEFTTIGNWKQSGRDLDFNGERYYWSKHHEFLKFIDLPKHIDQPIELATNLAKPETFKYGVGTEVPTLAIEEDDYSLLIANGWKMIDGPAFSTDPWKYRDYIVSSKAEFTFAKDQNIRLKSGWFSERSACYLAASRPVITQDTGFDSVLPTGTGLFSFNTMDEILSAVEAINTNYEKHSAAALEIANEYFSGQVVMKKLLDDLGL